MTMIDDRPAPNPARSLANREFYDDFEPIGPGTLAGNYLRSFWQPVYRAKDLRTGTARPLRILAQDFTIFRGASGKPQVLASRCPHRGTVLSAGWVEGDEVRCFYHGWKFSADGSCTEQPAEKDGFKDTVCVRSYPTREYLGLIFAYLGPGEAPPFFRLKIFEDDRSYLSVKASMRRCSYFNQLENGVDEAHINFVHRISSFAEAGFTKEIPEVFTRETDYGIERAAKRGDQVRIGHCLLPNVLFTSVVDPAAGWMQHIAWRVPVENDSSVSFVVDQVRLSGAELERYLTTARERHQKLVGLPSPDDVGRAILRGELSLDDVGQRSDLLNIQDVVALVGQEGAFRARDRLGRSDVSVVLLRRIFAREIRLLSEGKPTKQWLWPEDLCVTTRPASDFSISKG